MILVKYIYLPFFFSFLPVKVSVVAARSAELIRDVILPAHLQSGGGNVFLPVARDIHHLVTMISKVTQSTRWAGSSLSLCLPLDGWAVVWLMEKPRTRAASTAQIDEWFIFLTRTHKTDLFAKWAGLYNFWTRVKWRICVHLISSPSV